MTQVPFANHHRTVAGLLECLWQEALVGRQTILARRWDHGGLQTVAERITAGQECCASRRAHWLNIELFEPRPGFSQLIHVWGLDVGAVEGGVFPSPSIRDG